MSVFDDTVTLEFDEYPDLSVVMQVSIPVRAYLAALETFDDPDNTLEPGPWLMALCDLVDTFRLSWTLDGDAADQPGGLIVGIARSWLRAIAQVPVPLARRSSGTAPSPEDLTNPPTSSEPISSAPS